MAAALAKNWVPSGKLNLGDNVLASNICTGLVGSHDVRGARTLDAKVTLFWKVIAVSCEIIINKQLCSPDALRIGY